MKGCGAMQQAGRQSHLCPSITAPFLGVLLLTRSSPSFWGLCRFTQSDICLRESKKKSASFRLITWGGSRFRRGCGLSGVWPVAGRGRLRSSS